MSDSLPSSNEGLMHLDRLRYEDLLSWLERALRGRESLPLIVPDETPESPILRERRLSPRVRDDLRVACGTLLRRFIHEPSDDEDYVLALLRLAVGFQLREAATDLHALAENHNSFSALPSNQSWAVLSSLLDLRAPLPLIFWKEIAARYPARHGAMAVAGLLNHGYHSAFQALPSLPDDEPVADALYVVLDQHADLLNPEERRNMAAAATEVLPECKPQIRGAVQDWIQADPKHDSIGATSTNLRRKLSDALAAFATRSDTAYEPQPRPARLIPQAAI